MAKMWIACGHPLRGNVFDIKQRTKLNFKRYLRKIRYNGAEFPKTPSQWRKVINVAKLDRSRRADRIPNVSWIILNAIFEKLGIMVPNFLRLLASGEK